MSRRSCRSRSLTLLWLVPLLAATACQAPDGAIAVTLASPSSTAYTSDTVTIQVSVNGEVDAVELYRDGAPLVELAPPYTYTWDTRAEPEGAYEIAALARRGTQTSSSEPVTVVVDRTPPHVAARDPAPNQDHVAVDASIIVDVTEPLAPSSVSSASVRLEAIGQGPLDVDVTLSEDGHRLTIVPDPLPEPPAELELELTDAITDRAGNALAAPAPWSWSVPVWRRLGGYLNVDANIAARTPRVAMDAEERPLVIWLEDLPDSKAPADLYVKRWDGEAWTQFAHRAVVVRNVFRMDGAGSVGGQPDPDVTYGAVAIGPDDRPLIAWLERFDEPDGSTSRHFVRAWDGFAFRQVGVPLDVGGLSFEPFGLATTPGGVPVLARPVYDQEGRGGQLAVWRLNAP